MSEQGCSTDKPPGHDDPWPPTETFFFYIAGDSPNSENANQIENFSFVSNGVFAIQYVTRILGIPSENTALLISGSEEEVKRGLKSTKQRLYIQLKDKIVTEAYPNDIHIDFYTDINEISDSITTITEGHPNACIYVVLDDHGTETDFGILNYNEFYQIFRSFDNRALRFYVEACRSGSLKEKIELQDSLYTQINLITQKNSPINFNHFYFLNQLINKYNDMNKIKEMIDLISSLDSSLLHIPLTCEVMLNTYDYEYIVKNVQRKFSKKKVLDKALPDFDNDFINDLKSVNLNDPVRFCVLLTAVNELKLFRKNKARAIAKYFDEKVLDTLMQLRSSIPEAELKNDFTKLKDAELLFPPHEDIKVLTSSGTFSPSLTNISIRIDPYNKIITGSPFISAVFNEIFFNFTDDPVNLDSIISELTMDDESGFKEYAAPDSKTNKLFKRSWSRLFPQKYESEKTSNDRLFLFCKDDIKAKVAGVRCAVTLIKQYLESVNNELGLPIPKESEQEIEVLKVPKEAVRSAFAEKELKMYREIDAIAALTFGMESELTKPILNGIPDWMKIIVSAASYLSRDRAEAVAISNTAFDRMNRIIDDVALEKFQTQPSALIRTAVMESIDAQAAAIAVFEALISDSSYDTDTPEDLLNKIRTLFNFGSSFGSIYQDMINIKMPTYNYIHEMIQGIFVKIDEFKDIVMEKVLEGCIENASNISVISQDSSMIHEELFIKAQEYLCDQIRRVITVVLTYRVSDLDSVHDIITTTDKFKYSHKYEDIATCAINLIDMDLIGQVGILLIAKELNEATDLSAIADKISGQECLTKQFSSMTNQPNIPELIIFLEKKIINNIWSLVEKVIEFNQEIMQSVKSSFICNSDKVIFRQVIYQLCSEELHNHDIINEINSVRPGIDEKTSKLAIDNVLMCGMQLHRKVIMGVMDQNIPRELEEISAIIPRCKESALLSAEQYISKISDELLCPETTDVSFLSDFDKAQVQQAALELVAHLVVGSGDRSDVLFEMSTVIEKYINQLGIDTRNITPQFEDTLMLFGFENFELGGKDKKRNRRPRSSNQKKEEADVYDPITGKNIDDPSDDSYYSDDDCGFNGSGQFLTIKNLRSKKDTVETEEDKEFDPSLIDDVKKNANLRHRRYGEDMFWAFSYLFKKRVAKLGIDFEHVLSSDIIPGSTAVYDMSYEEVKKIVPFTHVPLYQWYARSYMQLFYEHTNVIEKLGKAFVRSFDDADRILAPIYFRRKTYKRERK